MNIQHNPPSEFLKKEKRLGITVTSELKALWAVEIDLMLTLVEMCRKHGLRIYADGGTLLGAVRHKGYIPWDDDIDMVMLRDDYDKLMQLADEFPHPYFLQNVYTDPHYTHRHAQLRNSDTACWGVKDGHCGEKFNQGIFVDIFPADYLPLTPRGFSRYYKKEGMAKLKFRMVSKIINRMPERLYRWLRNHTETLSDKVMYEHYEAVLRSEQGGVLSPVCETSFNHASPIQQYDEYGEPQMVPFEYAEIPIPMQPHAMLERQYGKDYMTPLHLSAYHSEMCFDVEHSYKEHR